MALHWDQKVSKLLQSNSKRFILLAPRTTVFPNVMHVCKGSKVEISTWSKILVYTILANAFLLINNIDSMLLPCISAKLSPHLCAFTVRVAHKEIVRGAPGWTCFALISNMYLTYTIHRTWGTMWKNGSSNIAVTSKLRKMMFWTAVVHEQNDRAGMIATSRHPKLHLFK